MFNHIIDLDERTDAIRNYECSLKQSIKQLQTTVEALQSKLSIIIHNVSLSLIRDEPYNYNKSIFVNKQINFIKKIIRENENEIELIKQKLNIYKDL